MSNEGVIRIKGDTKELVSALEKAGVKFQQLGAHAEKAVGHSKTFGQAWDHANQHLVRSMIHMVSIGGAVKEATALIREFQTESEKAAKNLGDLGLKRERAANQLGISPETAEGLVGGASPIARADREAFFAKSGEMTQVGRTRRKLTLKEVSLRQAAFNAGMDPADIEKATERGTLESLNPAGFRASLSPEMQAHYDANVQVNAADDLAEERNARGGDERRVREANYKATTAKFGPLGAIFRNPVSTAVATEFDTTEGNRPFYEGGVMESHGWGLTAPSPLKRAIEEQTQALKPPVSVGREAR
jgi:hypothetical protein